MAGRHQDGAATRHAGQQRAGPLGLPGIEAGEGLVEQQQARIRQENVGQGDAAALAQRELADKHLLQAVEAAEDLELIAVWQDLVTHTEHHFGQEDRWMEATKYASGNCHSVQHKVVLQVMREGIVRAEQGDLQPIRIMTGELAQWFPQHAQMMDASLALHLRRVGFDPATGVVHAPDALPAELIQGCGSTHSCVDHPEKEPAAAA